MASLVPPEILGKYLPTSDFSSGREVYKHMSQDMYLLTTPGKVWWCVSPVRPDINSLKDSILRSGTAPSLCPADRRARYRKKEGMECNSWRFKNAENKWIEVPEIHVTCDTCLNHSTGNQNISDS